MRNLKQSTAANVMVLMTDSTDHVAGKAGLTLTITASKDGAAFGAIAPAVSDRGSGWYNLALTGAMTNTLGDLAGHVTAAGADPTDFLCRVVGYDPATAWVSTAAQPGDAMALTSAYDKAKTAAQAGDAMTLPTEYDAAKTAAQAGDAMTLTVAYDSAKTAAQEGDTMELSPSALDAIAAIDPVVEGEITEKGVHRLMLARFGGKTSGAGTPTLLFKSQDGNKNRLIYTVDPTTGERSYVSLDVS